MHIFFHKPSTSMSHLTEILHRKRERWTWMDTRIERESKAWPVGLGSTTPLANFSVCLSVVQQDQDVCTQNKQQWRHRTFRLSESVWTQEKPEAGSFVSTPAAAAAAAWPKSKLARFVFSCDPSFCPITCPCHHRQRKKLSTSGHLGSFVC